MKTCKTPYGDECIAIDQESRLGRLIMEQTRGHWQRDVARNLCNQGYIIGYLAAGKLKGNARKYQGHYSESLTNLMYRIEDALANQSPYKLASGDVGPKGAYGYYLTV